MNKYSFIVAFFIIFTSFSQNYKGELNTIKEEGLHKIMLPQKVRSSCNENFNSLRIKDSQNNEVPYVLIRNNDKKFASFNPIEIDSKKTIKDSITVVIFENKARKTQDHITLQIANTKIAKSYTVFSSNDKEKWFGLISNRYLSTNNKPQKNENGTVFLEKTIHFPLNSYNYLRINFNDKESLPINIINAGVYVNKFFKQTLNELSGYKQEIVTIKEKKVTQLRFTALNKHRINSISFNISDSFYLRNAKLIVPKTRKIKKRTETYSQVISQFELSSKRKNTFVFDSLNEKEFIIEINNQDNPSLTINDVQLLQKPIYLITNLKKKENYQIVVNHALSKPSYDLANFVSNNITTLKEARILNFQEIEKKKIKEKEIPFWETNLFMWLCIVLGGALVAYFAVGLIKDISNKENIN